MRANILGPISSVSWQHDHSTAGAQIAARQYGKLGKPVAYAIAGHHTGLADGFATGKTRDAMRWASA